MRSVLSIIFCLQFALFSTTVLSYCAQEECALESRSDDLVHAQDSSEDEMIQKLDNHTHRHQVDVRPQLISQEVRGVSEKIVSKKIRVSDIEIKNRSKIFFHPTNAKKWNNSLFSYSKQHRILETIRIIC